MGPISLSKTITQALVMVVTGFLLSLLFKSSWFRKKFMPKNEMKELEAVDRISNNNIRHKNTRSYNLKTDIGNFILTEALAFGVGLYILLMIYFKKSQFRLFSIYPIAAIMAILFIFCGVFMLFRQATRVKISPGEILIVKLFSKSYVINSFDIDKIICYWGFTGGIRSKRYYSVYVFLKNTKKFHFRIDFMSAINSEKLLDYFRSNFITEEKKLRYF